MEAVIAQRRIILMARAAVLNDVISTSRRGLRWKCVRSIRKDYCFLFERDILWNAYCEEIPRLGVSQSALNLSLVRLCFL